MKPTTTTSPTFRRQLVGLAVAACFAGAVHGNPTGPAVANGSASFATSGNTLTVTNTPGTIINWQAFSIRPDEITRFIQSGAASAVLNRVTGGQQSALLGQLLSNGRVFLINPNGVTIGAGARIDTAGFVASSLSLSNEDFLAGRFRFTDPGNAGTVTNAGTINAHSGGPVYLVAPSVENHGVINAPNGEILLAAGKSVELVAAASPHLRVQVQAGGETLNVGQLVAESGRVGLYGAAIRNSGTISADSASVNAAGNVVLQAARDVTLDATSVVTASGPKGGTVLVQAEQGTLLVEGRVDAKGAADRGGEVKLLGERVGVVGAARVDASGANGGGTVLVGGDYQGKNPAVQNAQATYVDADASLRADALDSGDGGKVIVWADGATRFAGAASARGGAASGNGGFIEVSGKDYLEFRGTPDTRAPNGADGMLLLDPTNITISTAVTGSGTCPPAGPCFALTGNPATANLNVTDLVNALANTNVTVNTASTAPSAGDITVQNAVTYTGATARTLTLTANRNISVDAPIATTNGSLGVTMTTAGAGTVAINQAVTTRGGAFAATGPGGITSAAAGTIDTTGGNNQNGGAVTLTSAGGAVNLAGAIISSGGTQVAAGVGRNGGVVTVNGTSTTAGAITARGTNAVGANNAGGNGGAVTLNANAAGGALQANGAIDTRGGNSAGTGNTGNGGAVLLRAADAGTVATLAAATIDTTGGRGQTGGGVTVTGVAAANTLASVNLQGAITTQGGAGATVGKAGGAVNITQAEMIVLGAAISTRGSDALTANNVGGTGGQVFADARDLAATAAILPSIQVAAAIDTRGGNSVGTGNTGSGGAVQLRTSSGGAIASTAAGTVNTTGGRGQTGGSFTIAGIAAADTVATVNLAGAITAQGGAAASAGKNGGAVNITQAETIVLAAPISTRGSDALTANNVGGTGGQVFVDARDLASTAATLPSIQVAATINTRGGDSLGTGNTGNGGAVRLRTAAGGSVTGTAAASISTTGGRGQTGGNVTISGIVAADTLATVNLAGAINADGGVAAASGTLGGKNAGTVAIGNATTIALGAISARGSNAGGGSTVGGNGGPVAINRLGAASAVALNGTIDTRGGDSAGTGDTGNGGPVTIDGGTAPNLGTLTLAAGANIDTRGGRGQIGGAVIIRDFTNVAMAGSSVDTSGGAAATNSATTGAGKNAGTIAITGTGTVSTGALTSRGNNAVAGSGKAGGAGGAVTVTGGGVALTGSIASGGGSGDGAGAAGAGGAVGINGGVAGGITQVAASTVNAGLAAITVDANDGAINLAGTLTTTNNTATAVVIRDATTAALGTVNAAVGTVVLGQAGVNNLSGAVTQNAGSAITAATLTAVGGSAVTLGNANQVATLGASTATGGLTLNNGNNALTVAGNVTTTNSAVAISTGTGTYTQNNNIDVSAGSGGITVTADQVVIGTNAGNNALTTSGTLALKPASPGQPMRIGSAAGVDTPGTFELRAVEITAIATGATGPIVIGDAAASTGALTVAGPVALGGKTLTLNAGIMADAGTQAITAQNLALNARTGTIGAGANPIDVAVTNLRVTTQNQNAFVGAAGGYNLGPAATSVGTATLGLAAGGAVTQSAGVPVTAGSLVLSGAGGNFTLAQNNSVDTFAANTGAVNFVNGKAVTVGTVNGVAGATGTGSVSIRTLTGAGNDITLANSVAATGAGANVTIASGEDIHYGTATLAAGAGGRWLTYSRNPATDTGMIPAPGNAKPNLYNSTFAALGPGVVLPATGNHHIYSYQPQLEYTATPASRVYGEANPALAGTVVGLVNGDTAADAYSGTLSFTSPAVPASNVGSYAVNGSGLTSDIGYALVQAPANANALTVTQRPITLTAGSAARDYGDPNPAVAVTPNPTGPGTGLASFDTLAAAFPTVGAASGAIGTTNVGTYAAGANAYSVTGATNPNYNPTLVQGTLTINPATLNYVANAANRQYGDPNPALSGNVTGFKNGETIAGATTGTLAFTTAAVGTTPVGDYAIDGGGLAANNGNYVFVQALGNATALAIAPRTITLDAGSAARIYGDPNPVPAPLYTLGGNGMANAENAQTLFGFTVASGAGANTPVGAYSTGANAYNVAGTAVGVNGNYNITAINPGTLTIGQRPLTATADAGQTKIYGEPNPALYAYTLTSGTLVGGDALSGATTRVVGENVGTYPIQQGTLTAGANYALTFVSNDFSITTRPITITANPGQIKIYGGADPVFAYGVVGGPGTTGPAIVAGDSLVGALGRTAGQNVGLYAINQGTLAPNVPANYTVTFVPNNFSIMPAALNVVANAQTKVYGTPDPALSYNATGFQFADTPATVLTGGLARVAGETVAGGPYAINQGTLASNPNYTIAYTGNNLVIRPATLTIAANNAARLYGDPNPALTATYTGLANGDSPAAIPGVALTTPATIVSNVGPYAINVASGLNSNYTITTIDGLLIISPAPLTIAANDAARDFGQPNPPFTATSTGFRLGQTVGNLNGALAITTPATVTSPGGPYPITPSGVASANYAITFVNGTLIVGQAPPPIAQVPPPSDPALITAVDRSANDTFDSIQPVSVRAVGCLVLERPGVRRVLNRCY